MSEIDDGAGIVFGGTTMPYINLDTSIASSIHPKDQTRGTIQSSRPTEEPHPEDADGLENYARGLIEQARKAPTVDQFLLLSQAKQKLSDAHLLRQKAAGLEPDEQTRAELFRAQENMNNLYEYCRILFIQLHSR